MIKQPNNTLILKLPKLHAGQKKVIENRSRFTVVSCGRRFGKSTLGVVIASESILTGKRILWGAPTIRMGMEVWRKMLSLYAPLIQKANSTEKRIQFITGSVFELFSLDNPDTIRGRRYDSVLLDECAFITKLKDIWEQIIRPTLSDTRGRCVMFSTPKGAGFFKQCFDRGLDPYQLEWVSHSMPTSSNPFIHPDEIEAARKELPEAIFEQEYLAKFVESLGGVFHRIRAAIANVLKPKREKSHEYTAGFDMARLNDFSVVTVYDTSVEPAQLVYFDRFQKIDWRVQIERLKQAFKNWRFKKLICDGTGVGDPIVEALRGAIPGTRVIDVKLNAINKEQMVQSLALAFERGELQIPDEPVMIAELEAFEKTVNPNTGRSRYAAPSNMTDDIVMSMVLGWYGVTSINDKVSVMSLFNVYGDLNPEESDPSYWDDVKEYYTDDEEDEDLEAEINEYYNDEEDEDLEAEINEYYNDEEESKPPNPKGGRNNAPAPRPFSAV